MKRLLQLTVIASLFFSAAANAQENRNINNQYGPPTYTGGTVASTSESFALYNQQRNANQNARSVTSPITTIYPNPAINSTEVILQGPTLGSTNVSIISMNGEILLSWEFPPNTSSFNLDVSSLPIGLYALHLTETGKEPQIRKLYKCE